MSKKACLSFGLSAQAVPSDSCGLLVQPHAVSAGAFGRIQSGICCPEQLLRGFVDAGACAGDAKAAGYAATDALLMGYAQVAGRQAHAFGDRIGTVGIGSRQDGDEFFATITRHRVFDPEERFAERAGDRLEADVTRLVAIDVIELLEKIDIADDDAERAFGANAAFPFSGQGVIEMPPIRDAGQAVKNGDFLELSMHGADFLLSRCDAEHGSNLGQ